MISVSSRTPTQAAALAADLRTVWEACFAGPGGERWSPEQLHAGISSPGYRLVVATAGDGAVVGFAHGFSGDERDEVPRRLARRVGEQVLDDVGAHFQLVELAVLPSARRHGLGGALHDALLATTPHHRAVLVTSVDDDDPGLRLYRSRGWRTLGLLDERSRVMRWDRASPRGQRPP